MIDLRLALVGLYVGLGRRFWGAAVNTAVDTAGGAAGGAAGLVAAAAVVLVKNARAVVLRLLEAPVNDVVRVAAPHNGVLAAAELGRVLAEQLLEVRRALVARVNARKELYECLERRPLLTRGLLRVLAQNRVQQLPARVADLRPHSHVRHLAHDRLAAGQTVNREAAVLLGLVFGLEIGCLVGLL